jgi:exportin-2 (importin alpha re-exporter)
MLSKYAESPEANWRCKDVALYMVTSLAANTQSQKHGYHLVNLTDFATNNILPELNRPDGKPTS